MTNRERAVGEDVFAEGGALCNQHFFLLSHRRPLFDARDAAGLDSRDRRTSVRADGPVKSVCRVAGCPATRHSVNQFFEYSSTISCSLTCVSMTARAGRE
jgi:hypothetical protein